MPPRRREAQQPLGPVLGAKHAGRVTRRQTGHLPAPIQRLSNDWNWLRPVQRTLRAPKRAARRAARRAPPPSSSSSSSSASDSSSTASTSSTPAPSFSSQRPTPQENFESFFTPGLIYTVGRRILKDTEDPFGPSLNLCRDDVKSLSLVSRSLYSNLRAVRNIDVAFEKSRCDNSIPPTKYVSTRGYWYPNERPDIGPWTGCPIPAEHQSPVRRCEGFARGYRTALHPNHGPDHWVCSPCNRRGVSGTPLMRLWLPLCYPCSVDFRNAPGRAEQELQRPLHDCQCDFEFGSASVTLCFACRREEARLHEQAMWHNLHAVYATPAGAPQNPWTASNSYGTGLPPLGLLGPSDPGPHGRWHIYLTCQSRGTNRSFQVVNCGCPCGADHMAKSMSHFTTLGAVQVRLCLRCGKEKWDEFEEINGEGL
ncbi:MAG: hypothetical protein Q9227_007678 [Pyrenula ochraceoflavens]